MSADVYACDADLESCASSADSHTSYAFLIEADADPDVLSRVANQFNYANSAPYRVSLLRRSEDIVGIEIELRRVAPATAESIRRKLERLTCIIDVQLSAFA